MKLAYALFLAFVTFVCSAYGVTISSPASGTTYYGGNVITAIGTASQATGNVVLTLTNGIVTTTSATTAFTGNAWSATVVVPYGYSGVFTLTAAIAGDTPASAAVSLIVAQVSTPTIISPCIPCNPCYNPCRRPCYNPCRNPCRRSFRRCDEGAEGEVAEFEGEMQEGCPVDGVQEGQEGCPINAESDFAIPEHIEA